MRKIDACLLTAILALPSLAAANPPTIPLNSEEVCGDRIAPQPPPPRYPPQAIRRREEGSVLLSAHLDESGFPSEHTIIEGSGSSLLDRAAWDAFVRTKFLPGPARYCKIDMSFCLSDLDSAPDGGCAKRPGTAAQATPKELGPPPMRYGSDPAKN